MKIANSILVAFVVPALLVQACGDNRRAKNYNEKTLVDQQGLTFINQALEGGLAEVKSSMLAQEKSKNSRVIEFAAMMIADHSQAGTELAEIAKKQMVSTADTLSSAHSKTIDSLGTLKGGSFDKGYMALMVKDHAMAVMIFDEASRNKNSRIQDFARKTLPSLKAHQDSANAIFASLK